MEFEFLIDQELRKITLEKAGSSFVVRDAAGSWEADIRPISENALSVLAAGRSHVLYIARDKDRKVLFVDGRQFEVREPGQAAGGFLKGEDKALEGRILIKAPMPGKVVKVDVAEGQEVRKNQTLAVVEAMKMENEVKSPVQGVVKKVLAVAGDAVDTEKVLLEVEAKNKEGAT